jgi:phosphohistidine phosphatase SixA
LNATEVFRAQKQNLAMQAGAIRMLLVTPPPQGTNRVLVGHAVPPTIVYPLLAHVQEGHSLVFRPEGTRFHFVAALSPGQWQWIGRQPVLDQAQVIVQASQPVATVAPQVPMPPLINPARELKGPALVAALKRGGYNLFMRHASATVGTDQDLLKVAEWWKDCSIQRNLSDMGKEQARKVGSRMQELKLPISKVMVSQFCRVRDTAALMGIGPVEMTEDLNHVIGQRPGTDINALRFARLATAPPANTNVLMVSHTHGSPRNEERIMSGIQEAEIVVYLPDGKGGAEPIGRIASAEWDQLISEIGANK